MLQYLVFILVFLPLSITNNIEITFKKVTFRGFSSEKGEFKKTITDITNLKDGFADDNLEWVSISNQNIPVIYANSLTDLGGLRELWIKYSNIEDLRPGPFGNDTTSLYEVSFEGNKLKKIVFGVFNHLKIHVLILKANNLITIDPQAFDDMPNLQTINLQKNNLLAWIPDWFKNSWPFLILAEDNEIDHIPSDAFKNVGNLESYKNHGNGFSIYLTRNKIKSLHPKSFASVTDINVLGLNDNLIDGFDEHLLDAVNVKYLFLQNNNIACLHGDLSKILKADYNHLDLNPLECECSLKIRDWLKENKKDNVFFVKMECLVNENETEKKH